VNILLVGFDAAWTEENVGALTAVLRRKDGSYHQVSPPECASYSESEIMIACWQEQYDATATLILLDQPTIVKNARGQRPVEHLVCSVISRYKGGMQPAYTGKTTMFGSNAPVWRFLSRYGGAANPFEALAQGAVYETYPALTMIALGWAETDDGISRLPKYNPRNRNFCRPDWRRVCTLAADEFRQHLITELASWMDMVSQLARPRKADQDRVDSCLCLLVAIHLLSGEEGLFVGEQGTGYIVVPHSLRLMEELSSRCVKAGRDPRDWVRSFRIT